MKKDEFYQLWLKHFAVGISEEDLHKHVVATGNYIWHAFSWKLLDAERFLEGEEAIAAYENADKQGALYIEWFKEDETRIIPQRLWDATALSKKEEVYVVAPDFSWTYIKTHEMMCGPYFMVCTR